MAPKGEPDPRTIVGAEVHARAASVLRTLENKRIHGAEAGTKLLDGVVLSIKEERSSNGRRLVYIEIEFAYGDGAFKKVKTLHNSQVIAGKAPPPKNQYELNETNENNPFHQTEKMRQTLIRPGDPISLNAKAPSKSIEEINAWMKQSTAIILNI